MEAIVISQRHLIKFFSEGTRPQEPSYPPHTPHFRMYLPLSIILARGLLPCQ